MFLNNPAMIEIHGLNRARGGDPSKGYFGLPVPRSGSRTILEDRRHTSGFCHFCYTGSMGRLGSEKVEFDAIENR